MTEHYELLYIVSANYTSAELPKINQKVKDLLAEQETKIIHEEEIGKQKLAYQIDKNSHGHYILVDFDADKQSIAELNKGIGLINEIIRFIIVTKKIKSAEEVAKETQIQEKRTKAKEIQIEEAALEPTLREKAKPTKQKEKVNFEDLDKKLDEILSGEDIL